FLRPSDEQRKAETSRRLAQASILGAVSSSPDADRSLLLALEAVRIADTPESESALRVALFKSEGTNNEGIPLEEHSDAVTMAAFSPDGKWVATASFDQSACIWAAASGQLTQKLLGHNNPVLNVAFSNDSRFVVTTSSNQTSGVGRVWDATTGQTVTILRG